MKQSRPKNFVGHIETKENVIECDLMLERMPDDYALTVHFNNMVAKYGQFTVEAFINLRFGMIKPKTKNKAA